MGGVLSRETEDAVILVYGFAVFAILLGGCDRRPNLPLSDPATSPPKTANPPSEPIPPPSPPPRKVLVVMAGQSNMMGIGQTKPFTSSPAVVMLYPNGDPANMYGPGASAGLYYTQARPGTQFYGLMCAQGSTAIDQWKPGSPLLETCLAGAKKVRDKEQATILGMFWDQGEQDAWLGTTDWPEKLTALARYSAQSLGVSTLPVIYSQLGQTDDDYSGRWEVFQVLQTQAQQPGFEMVATNDLPAIGHVHHDYAANLEIGRRFAEKMNGW